MPKFKVNVIQILLKNNKTANYGELVDEEQLTSKAETLVKDGFVIKPTKAELDAFNKSQKQEEKKVEAPKTTEPPKTGEPEK